MGKKLIVAIALLQIIVVASVSLAQEVQPTVQATDVYRFADLTVVDESIAQLTRYSNGLTAAIGTNDLTEGEVYTLWWVFFNNPENCSDGACSEDDIFQIQDGELVVDETGNFALNFDGIESAGITIQHAAGGFAADDTFNTSASVGIGEAPGIVVGNGLEDPFGAEVHLVVRTHGEPVASAYVDQLSTFGGGCDPIMALPCQDVQFAVFAPAGQ